MERAPHARNPLNRKVPSNPRYQNIGPTLKTGKTVRDVEILSNQNVAKRKGELFRRIRPTTLAKLIQEGGPKESIYNIGQEEDKFDDVSDTASIYSAAPSVFSVVTVNTEQLQAENDVEHIVLDLRDYDDYQACHIKDAISFPAPNITRDRFPQQLYAMRNTPGKLIIVYAWDERPGVEAAQRMVQRGYDNVYLVSGGLEEFAKQCYDLLEGYRLPPPPQDSPNKTMRGSVSTSSSFHRK